MNLRQFGPWAGAGVLVMACAAVFAAPGDNKGRATVTGQRFLQVGNYYVNASRIDYVARRGDRLVIVFGSEAGNQLELSGADAETMRRWLENRLADSRYQQREGHPQNGRPNVSQGNHPQGNPHNFSGPAGGGVRHQPGKSDSGTSRKRHPDRQSQQGAEGQNNRSLKSDE